MYPKDIFCNENHLRNSVSPSNIKYSIKHESTYWLLDIDFFYIINSLTVASLEPKWSSKRPPFYTTTKNSSVNCVIWHSDECGVSVPHCSFYLPLGSSFSCSETIFMYYQRFPWAVYLNAITSILKHLHYFRDVGQVQIRYLEWAKSSIDIHGLVEVFCPWVFSPILKD